MGDSKSVFAMRKAAQALEGDEKVALLMQAIKLVEEGEMEHGDEWERKAAAWTLIDLCKTCHAMKLTDEALAFLARLRLVDVSDDELLNKQRDYVVSLLDKVTIEAKRLDVLSKNGKERQAVEGYMELFNDEKLPLSLHESMGWAIYRLLKCDGAKMGSKSVMHLLALYLKLQHERPSLLHSFVLVYAERIFVEQEEWRFLKFLELWGVDTFRDEDWKETKKDDKVFKSLVSKCIKKACDAALSLPQIGDVAWLLRCVQKGLALNKGDVWLRRDYALLLSKLGQMDEARKVFKELLSALNDKFYFWHELAACYERDTKQRMAMLCKALTIERNEDFIGDVRLGLARCLIEEGMTGEAAVELMRYRDNREKNGWKLGSVYAELIPMVDKGVDKKRHNGALYREYAEIADAFAYQDIPAEPMVITDTYQDVNREGKKRDMCVLCSAKGVVVKVNRRRFAALKNAKVADVFVLKFVTDVQKGSKKVPVWIESVKEDQQFLGLKKTVSGLLRVTYKDKDGAAAGGAFPDFAFVSDFYVHRSVLKAAGIRADCNVRAVTLVDPKNKWRVVSLDRLN